MSAQCSRASDFQNPIARDYPGEVFEEKVTDRLSHILHIFTAERITHDDSAPCGWHEKMVSPCLGPCPPNDVFLGWSYEPVTIVGGLCVSGVLNLLTQTCDLRVLVCKSLFLIGGCLLSFPSGFLLALQVLRVFLFPGVARLKVNPNLPPVLGLCCPLENPRVRRMSLY